MPWRPAAKSACSCSSFVDRTRQSVHILQHSPSRYALRCWNARTSTACTRHIVLPQLNPVVNTLESSTLVTSLIDLAGLYDYLLLVTTQATPYAVVQAIAEQCTRAMIIVSTSEIAHFVVPAKRVNTNDLASSLFVAHISEPTTIGVQDRYMAQLGRAVTHLLPAAMSLLEQCWEQQAAVSQLAAEAELTKAVDFVARHIAHQSVGIAFGGGGARGFAHLGVLERLLHYGIPLDYIA